MAITMTSPTEGEELLSVRAAATEDREVDGAEKREVGEDAK